jgi:gamma-glutamylcyclotransferase (GGCT)/AIG2-like uncharacterized protein YtfP
LLDRLFCYGTLRDPAVIAALLGRVPQSRRAVLGEHRRGLLAGHPWAGVAPAVASAVEGTLYDGLRERELRLLDRYEGADYRRATIRLTIGNTTGRSWIYLPRRPLATGPAPPERPPTDAALWRALGLPRRKTSRRAARHRFGRSD